MADALRSVNTLLRRPPSRFATALMPLAIVGVLVLSPLVTPAAARTEAFEVGDANKDQLPTGKEADGILGDFVMRNDLIEATISGDLPRRKANIGAFYAAITPGCVYDLSVRGSRNDQLTLFSPSFQHGDVNYVRILDGGKSGKASIETVVSAARNSGLYKRHLYHLQDGWRGLLIETTLRNEADSTHRVGTEDRLEDQSDARNVGENTVIYITDPADKAGYAFGWVGEAPADTLELLPGQEVTYKRFLAVGTSPAEAYGLVVQRQGEFGTVSGVIVGPSGKGVPTAHIEITSDDDTLAVYPDADGRFNFALRPGSYDFLVTDVGRAEVRQSLALVSGEVRSLSFEMDRASTVVLDIRDEDGRSIPCKVQFIGIEGSESPDLGPRTRAHGCLDQYHSETGRFEVQVPPGDYRVVVTRGIEFGHLEKEIQLRSGRTEKIRGVLRRLVDTEGWVSTDFHNHSTPSGDNVTNSRDRVINLAAEHIEFAPTTEHNRLYDWQPFIDELGLADEVVTIPGLELTVKGPHLNAFPFVPDPYAQDGGAPERQLVYLRPAAPRYTDPRINAIMLRDFQRSSEDLMPERWVHLNHPNMSLDFVDRDKDGREDGGYRGLAALIDGSELCGFWTCTERGEDILARSPWRIVTRDEEELVRHRREFIWLQLLNRGHRYTAIAVSDAHAIHGNGVGGWRTYITSSSDRPADIDWKEVVGNAKAGQALITNGPFLRVETVDGTLPGGSARAQGSIALRIEVQCTDWIDIDRVQILVNGRQHPDVNFTKESHPDWFSDGVVKFNRVIDVPLSQDSHIIIAAIGENSDLSVGYGSSWQARMKPVAYTNPIWVDVDGGGFVPNGDDLGWDLPVMEKTVEEVRKMLLAAGLDDSGV